ncbi:hypothetical protein A2382_04675 [Candidatus Woesebacteria bacterium RIFOXYB1_FULL_38_16]|uniref:ChbG/HpnK family deacetylase n=1 Tax=Candidatus Woesebacteria bacterium RIFOXYB1_FULL_38_16 TaxID=1802538 RepID=A0A1F8CUE2_9BACT|nr:MAG: hypothetical protein A2191_02155 [Candidatus Woesebacteria bacterium RIFOXYA1_FULL_38_9]OGM79953.1 MAG: hypothetical protein A2382_04675 [Candidatus Woesebacteria bacterium RIFOXYB1_FULL_38_16]
MKKNLKVIFHCDDFGHNFGFTKTIAEIYRARGIVSSASITVNGTAYEYAKTIYRKEMKGLGLGLHINITDGKAMTVSLADSQGNYKRRFQHYFFEICVLGNRKLLSMIERDIEKQFVKALVTDRLPIDHVNGHDHIHLISGISEIVIKLARKYRVKNIRIPKEPYFLVGEWKHDLAPFLNKNLIKFMLLNFFAGRMIKIAKKAGFYASGCVYGVLHTDHMDSIVIRACLKDAIKKNMGLIEIISHPAVKDTQDKEYTSDFFRWYTTKKTRVIEKKALLSLELRDFINRHGVRLVSYRSR